MDLDLFVEQDESFDLGDFYPGTASAFVQEGKRLGVPIRVNALATYYNLDLFDRHGVAYPSANWTWDEFLDAAEVNGAFGSGNEAIRQGILQDEVALWHTWFSERDELAGGDKRWGIVPLPQDVQPFTVGILEGIYISAQAEHPEACWQWVSYLSAQPPQTLIPARRSIAESAEYTRQVGSDVAAAARAIVESVYLLSPRLSRAGDFGDLFEQAVEDVVHGRATPEEAMFWAQQEYDKRGQ